MKTAIVCDWLVSAGGAEKVLHEMLLCFPEADLYAVIDFFDDKLRNLTLGKKAQTTFIQKLPFAKKLYRYYLPLMPFAIGELNLNQYDLVISSSHAVAKGVITGPDQIHVSYVYTPMRYAWDLQHQYLSATGLNHKRLQGLITRYLLHKLRFWDIASSISVDHFMCISNFIARRIKKAYRREALVIYPPVDTSLFSPAQDQAKENFYVTASRLVPYKKIDLIVESFNAMPDKKLFVIGDGPDFSKIKRKAAANVTLLGFQSNDVLIRYLQRAKAFIFAAEEDFGILPLEAQSCGTPVIAYGKGGVLETVRAFPDEKNPTGLFFSEQSTSSICQAVHSFEKISELFTIESCVKQAALFSRAKFRETFKNYVLECVKVKPATNYKIDKPVTS